MQKGQVQSLVGELRFYMASGGAKKKKKKKKKERKTKMENVNKSRNTDEP